MLAIFLNRCLGHKVLGTDKTFRRFLEPGVSWSEVLNSAPVTLVPKNPLRAASSDPTSAALNALFASLPLPASSAPLQNPDQRFLDSEAFTAKFSSHLSGSLEKVNRRLMKRWNEAAADWGEMGGGMNGFALRMGEEGNGGLEEATERVGMAVDGGYTSTNVMVRLSLSPLTSRVDTDGKRGAASSVGEILHGASRRIHPVLSDHQIPPQVPTPQAPPIRTHPRAHRVEAIRPRGPRAIRTGGAEVGEGVGEGEDRCAGWVDGECCAAAWGEGECTVESEEEWRGATGSVDAYFPCCCGR
jgi:hypothetical protein